MRVITTRLPAARVVAPAVAFALTLMAFAGSAAAQGPIDLMRVAGAEVEWSAHAMHFDTPGGPIDAGVLRVRDTVDGIEMAFEPTPVPRSALSHPLVIGAAGAGVEPAGDALFVKPAVGAPVSGAHDPTTVHMLIGPEGAVKHLLRLVPACDAAGHCAVERVVWYALTPQAITVDSLPGALAPADRFPIEPGDTQFVSPW